VPTLTRAVFFKLNGLSKQQNRIICQKIAAQLDQWRVSFPAHVESSRATPGETSVCTHCEDRVLDGPVSEVNGSKVGH